MVQDESRFGEGEQPTERQKEVLDTVLRLLVEEGDALTVASVARRAAQQFFTLFGPKSGPKVRSI